MRRYFALLFFCYCGNIFAQDDAAMALQVFECDKYFSRTETFYSSVSCLSPLGNNKVSSVKVYWVHDPGNAEGQINNIGFGADNNISSIKIPAGWVAIVYDGQGLTGQSKTFTSSVTNLSAYGWNDRITSV